MRRFATPPGIRIAAIALMGLFLVTGCATRSAEINGGQTESPPNELRRQTIPATTQTDTAASGSTPQDKTAGEPAQPGEGPSASPLHSKAETQQRSVRTGSVLSDQTAVGDRVFFVADDQVSENAPVGSPSGADGTIEFNFDNAELNEVVRTLADILEIRYIADENLQGKVTVHTSGGISREHLLPVFFKILEINGLTAIKEGPIYRIAAVKDASRLPLGFRSKPFETAGLPPDDQVIIQVVPLKNVSPTDMTKIISPFTSEGATIVGHEPSKTLFLVDKRANISKILRMVEAFDLNIFTRISHRFYFLENSAAAETADILRELFGAANFQGESTRFIPIERLNAILAVTTDPNIYKKVDPILLQLDASGKSTEPRIFVYFVKNGTADELSDLLNRVFTGQPAITTVTKRDDPKYGFSRNPFAVRPKTDIVEEVVQTEPAIPSEESAALHTGVVIIPDPIRNALIIEATPSAYKSIESILDRIDVLPRQVLIEATIAEISLEDRTELGIEWEYFKDVNFSQNQVRRLSVGGTSGLSYAIEFSNNVLNSLDALAQKNKVNIISSPHVLASDNKEAKIDVSNEIPIISSETTITSGAEPLVTTDIQYRDTGVLLSVTPHINERGLVTMEIYQEVSEQSEDVTVAGESYPSFFKRAVDTTLTISHGQTIVLGGLIRENKSKGRRGVPVLMDMPLIGPLFGSRADDLSKNELIILLTPRVIDSLDDVAAVTAEFENKVVDVIKTMRPEMLGMPPVSPDSE